jgi:hypothetical protein
MPKTRSGSSPFSRSRIALAVLVAACLASPSLAGATTITFDDLGLVHGEIVTGVPGVTIVATNYSRSFDYAVAFDTEATGTADPDLEATSGGLPRWSGGNLVGQELGLALILQENETGCGDGVCDSPDDEGRRPAGTISFLFDQPVLSVGFDLIDVDSLGTENGFVTFRDVHGVGAVVDFSILLAGYEIGNNTANRIAPFTAEALGIGPIDEVVFKLAGSGAIDNVTYVAVPEPATALFLGIGLGILAASRRRTTR